jgi:hypothetical protein
MGFVNKLEGSKEKQTLGETLSSLRIDAFEAIFEKSLAAYEQSEAPHFRKACGPPGI